MAPTTDHPSDEDPRRLAGRVQRPNGERVPVEPDEAELAAQRQAAIDRDDPRALADLVPRS